MIRQPRSDATRRSTRSGWTAVGRRLDSSIATSAAVSPYATASCMSRRSPFSLWSFRAPEFAPPCTTRPVARASLISRGVPIASAPILLANSASTGPPLRPKFGVDDPDDELADLRVGVAREETGHVLDPSIPRRLTRPDPDPGKRGEGAGGPRGTPDTAACRFEESSTDRPPDRWLQLSGSPRGQALAATAAFSKRTTVLLSTRTSGGAKKCMPT